MTRPSFAAGAAAVLFCVGCSNPMLPASPSAALTGATAIESAALAGAPAIESAAGAAAASSQAVRSVPFHGRFEGTQTVTPAPPYAHVEMSAGGNATHLGRFTIALPHTVNLAAQSASGVATLVAANGDTIVADFTGQSQLVDGVRHITEQATITGGTGRFADATGSFTIERVFVPAAGTTSGSFEGTIWPPSAARP